MFGLDAERVRVITPARRRRASAARPGSLAEHTRRDRRGRAPLGRPVKLGRDPLGEPRLDAARPRPGAVLRAGLHARRPDHRHAGAGRRRRRRLRRLRRRARARPDAHDGAGRLRASRKIALRRARSALTNTTPMGAFRGAGRPEAAAQLERIMDMAAAELGIDPVEIRRRNFLAPDAFPFTHAVRRTLRHRRLRPAAARGAARSPTTTSCARSSAPGGRRGDPVQLGIGVSVVRRDHRGRRGQRVRRGHRARRRHRHDLARARPRTARATPPRSRCSSPTGSGSRSSKITLRAVRHRARAARRGHRRVAVAAARRQRRARRGRRRCWSRRASRAAELLEARRRRHRAHRRRRVRRARRAGARPSRGRRSRATARTSAAGLDFHQDGADVPVRRARRGRRGRHRDGAGHAASATSPSTTAAASSTRCSSPASSTAASRRASRRRCTRRSVFDADGQPLTATLADYRDAERRRPVLRSRPPTPRRPRRCNPLGAKGIGESATIGSTPAVQNAVVDALAPLGVRHIDMPCTPERVWRAIRDARAGRAADPWREPPAVFAGLPVRGAGRPGGRGDDLNLPASGARWTSCCAAEADCET